jgi:O-antigen/teichoic acid export membrane protein
MNLSQIEDGHSSASFPLSQITSEFRHALKIWPLRGFFALLDQGLISGSNFLVAILLARWLAPRQYGAYALAFEIFLFLSVVYGALVLEPMSVFGPSIYKNDFQGYLGILLRIHCVMSILIIAAVFAAAGVLYALKPGSSLSDAVFGVGVASPCLLLFWLARRGFYVHLLPQKAVLGACAYSAIMLAGLLIVYRLHTLSSLSAFLMMAAGAVLTGPAMLHWFKTRMPQPAVRHFRVKDIVRQHWNYGRWALASSVVIWFSTAIYYPLLGSFFDLAKTGEYRALMNLSSPIGQAFVAMSLLSLPHASRAHHEHGAAVAGRLVWKLTGIYVCGTSLYWLVLILVRGPVVHHLYGGKYAQITSLLPWVALGSIFRIAATAQAIVLRAMRSPAMVFVAYSAACVVAILVGVPCTRWFGLRGTLFAWVLSSAAALVGAIIMIRRKWSESNPLDEVPASALALQEEASINTQR